MALLKRGMCGEVCWEHSSTDRVRSATAEEGLPDRYFRTPLHEGGKEGGKEGRRLEVSEKEERREGEGDGRQEEEERGS